MLQAGEKGRAARVRRLLRGSGWRPGANFLHNSPVCGCAPTSTLPPQIVNPVRAVCLALLHLGAALAPSASAYTGSITRAYADTSRTRGSLAGSCSRAERLGQSIVKRLKEAGVGGKTTYKLLSVVVR